MGRMAGLRVEERRTLNLRGQADETPGYYDPGAQKAVGPFRPGTGIAEALTAREEILPSRAL